ncbi:MAG: hypothetical protein R3D84_09265 [Paracoccaceae bacterium]
MSAGIGHNSGFVSEPGAGWRRHCWRRARADLLPSLPIEVVRLRVKRAAEIGLDYRTYASVRASSGHDVVAFLFSTNALRLLREGQPLPGERVRKLAALQGAARLIAVQPPLSVGAVAQALTGQGVTPDIVAPAPAAFAGWGRVRRDIRGLLAPGRHAPDTVLVIGETMAEREWAEAAGLAGYLAAERYFAPLAG